MKDKLFKVKRKRVDWFSAMVDDNRPEVLERYYLLRTRNPFISRNRCAYNALKTYYSTTAMDRYRILGSFYELL